MTPGIVHPFVQPETRATAGPDTDVIAQGYLTQFLFQAAPPPRRTRSRGDRVIGSNPLQFILVSTGRADPATMRLDPQSSVYR
jgi:hypothetical protein